jgi:hypothetical protein
MDVTTRAIAAGIFVFENINHISAFENEVRTIVIPAINPIPPVVGYGIHALTIVLGLVGALMFILSGTSLVPSKFERTSLRMLALFMVLITWTWWLRRSGTFFWDIVDNDERRMRIIHCLKNLSIYGFIVNLIQRGKSTATPKRKKN